MPAHDHNIAVQTTELTGTLSATGGKSNVKPMQGSGVFMGNGTCNGYGQNGPWASGSANYSSLKFNGSHSHQLEVERQGGNIPHQNMPPYITCYMWQRVA